jgi:hypothetical protein
MIALDCFNRTHDRKRRHDTLYELPEEFTVFGKRNKKELTMSSTLATCGEFSSPECSRSYMEESVEPVLVEERRVCMENASVSYMEQPTTTLTSPKATPTGHKGRSMNDYCTVLSTKKNKAVAVKTVHFNETPMVVVPAGDEPVRVETSCRGCRTSVTDNMFLVQCSFCNHSFCGVNCVCHCENCGGVFCHATCSTLNYSSIFVKTLCLECNDDERQRGNYYGPA